MLTFDTDLGRKLTDATRRGFTKGYKNVPTGIRSFFSVVMTDKKVEVFNDAVNDHFARPTPDGNDYYTGSEVLGDEFTLTQMKYTDSFEMTEGIEKFDQYAIAEALAGGDGVGSNVAKTVELYGQQLISQGAATSYVDHAGNTVNIACSDGGAIFANSHAINGSSATFDNLMATTFGQVGLEEAEELYRKILNHTGQRINFIPNVIFSTRKPSLTNLIKEYANSEGHPEDAFNGINTYKNAYTHVVLDYLDTDSSGSTDSAKDDYWGITHAGNSELMLRVAQEPTLQDPVKLPRNNNWLVKASTYFSTGIKNPYIVLSAA